MSIGRMTHKAMLTPQGTWNESLPFFVPIRSTLVLLLLECDIHRLASGVISGRRRTFPPRVPRVHRGGGYQGR